MRYSGEVQQADSGVAATQGPWRRKERFIEDRNFDLSHLLRHIGELPWTIVCTSCVFSNQLQRARRSEEHSE
jgi:hypothetical protein